MKHSLIPDQTLHFQVISAMGKLLAFCKQSIELLGVKRYQEIV